MGDESFRVPAFLYRYRRLDTSFAMAEIEAAISRQEFFHTSPISWNDPFDFKPIYEKRSERDVAKAIRNFDPKKGLWNREDFSRVSGRNLTRSEYRMLSRQQKKPTFLAKAYRFSSERLVRDMPKNVVATCFSETEKSVPMWAHYSNNHTGICLELEYCEPDLVLPNEPIPLPVAYSSTRPRIDFLDIGKFTGRFSKASAATVEKKDIMDALFLTKSVDWSYEKEWRSIVQDKPEPSYVYIRFLKVTRILLGLRASHQSAAQVKEVVRDRVPLLSARLSENDFGLEFSTP